ncbi:MAG: chromate transporter [Lentisphaeria bacterium]|nr:chromate transporter [Lentisphaeria bacterium]
MTNIFHIFLLFCYFGLLCFGGGNALTPLYIDHLVNEQHWMTLQEFGDLTAISQMTPGPIGVNAATFFGFRRGGIPGAFVATIGLLVPSYFLVILALRSLKRWEKSFLVQGIMTGIHPATTGMILAALLIFMQMSVFSAEIPWGYWLGIVKNAPETAFFVRPLAVVIFCAATWLLYKGRISIMSVIFGSAAVGALGAAAGLS